MLTMMRNIYVGRENQFLLFYLFCEDRGYNSLVTYFFFTLVLLATDNDIHYRYIYPSQKKIIIAYDNFCYFIFFSKKQDKKWKGKFTRGIAYYCTWSDELSDRIRVRHKTWLIKWNSLMMRWCLIFFLVRLLRIAGMERPHCQWARHRKGNWPTAMRPSLERMRRMGLVPAPGSMVNALTRGCRSWSLWGKFN